MRHAPAYGPYSNMDNRNYFNVRTYQMSGPVEMTGGYNNYVVSLPYISGIFEVYSYIYSQNDCVGTTWIEVLVHI